MTYTRPIFYWATGTNNFLNLPVFGEIFPTTVPGGPVRYIAGLNGQSIGWDGYIPTNPFPQLLDPTLWNYEFVQYPASTISMNLSIEAGVQYVINKITANPPPGPPWACGGYSQGGAVAHRLVWETKSGRLVDYRSSLRACVTFGAPTREANHTWPGSSGWSGAVDIPDSTTGGHGLFPQVWPFLYRMIDTDPFVWDFAMPGDPITSVGDSVQGILASNFTGLSLNSVINLISTLVGLPFFIDWAKQNAVIPTGVPSVVDGGKAVALITDALGNVFNLDGGGHVLYPFFPPPAANGVIPSSGDTCYQIALRYLNQVGQQIYDQLNPTVPQPTTGPTYSWFSNLPVG